MSRDRVAGLPFAHRPFLCDTLQTTIARMSSAPPSPSSDLQSLCELGQEQLMRMEYLAAERTLERAEAIAWDARDFDTLARLYMPLQEARRQRRQRCGEGVVCLDLIAQSLEDRVDGRRVVENFPQG